MRERRAKVCDCAEKIPTSWLDPLLTGPEAVIGAWAQERIRLGKNAPDDEQIQEALRCAGTMKAER